jgi:hypothetical protein
VPRQAVSERVNRQHGFWKTCDTEKLTRSRSEVCRHCRCTLYGARMRSYLNCMYRFQAARSITAPTVLVLHALVNPNAVWFLVHCVPLGERHSSPRFEQETFVWPTPKKHSRLSASIATEDLTHAVITTRHRLTTGHLVISTPGKLRCLLGSNVLKPSIQQSVMSANCTNAPWHGGHTLA